MVLNAHRIPDLTDDYIDVKYRELTPAIDQILQICEGERSVVVCEKDGCRHNVDLHDVLYIEWVDDRSYVYTADDVYMMGASLTALEASLGQRRFIRISRMCLCNLFKIKSVSTGLNMRLTAEMSNGERVVVSRHYRDSLLHAIHKLAGEIGAKNEFS